MEVLSKFVDKVMEGGPFLGWAVESRGGGVISHLMFADDSLISLQRLHG